MSKKLNNNQSGCRQDHYIPSEDIEIPQGEVPKKLIKRYKELRKKHDYDYESEPITVGDYERYCKQIAAYRDLKDFVSYPI